MKKVCSLGYYNKVQRVIAKISGFHGVKGEIKLYPLVDDISVLDGLESLIIQGQNYELSSMRPHKQWLLVKLKGYDDLNSVETLTGEVEADIEEESEQGNYYIDDLIGLAVHDQDGNPVGEVTNYSSQAQDHIFIKLNDSFGLKSELILPFVDEYILDVVLGDYIRVKLDPELLELSR